MIGVHLVALGVSLCPFWLVTGVRFKSINKKIGVDMSDSKLKNSNLSPVEWVTEFMRIHKITYDYKTDSIKQNEEAIDNKLALSRLRLSALSNGMDHIKNYLPDALAVWKKEQSKSALKLIKTRVSYSASPSSLMDVWIESITGSNDNLNIKVMEHWIWQIKRKLGGLDVEHHIMPILYGKSGAGKSVAVRNLIGPLYESAIATDMSIFMDQFSKRQFSRNYIMFFDELDGAEGIDVNKLKQVITAPTLEYRVMKSEAFFSSKQNCTFIGCTNIPVRERIKDTTSARRFWQIETQDKIDWNIINNLDYLALWKSINEDAPSPILPFINELHKIQQEELRSRNLIEDWIESCCLFEKSGNEGTTTQELFNHFKKWCRWQNQSAIPTLQKFSRDLKLESKAFGYDIEPVHSYRGTMWPIKVIHIF